MDIAIIADDNKKELMAQFRLSPIKKYYENQIPPPPSLLFVPLFDLSPPQSCFSPALSL